VRSDPVARIAQAITSGRTADFSGDHEPITAEQLERAVFSTARQAHARGLQLENVRILGEVDLDGLRFSAPLVFNRCSFQGGLTLRVAHIGFVGLDECSIGYPGFGDTSQAIDLNGATLSHSLLIRSTSIAGPLVLYGTTVGGRVQLEGGCTIGSDASDDSISAASATIGGNFGIIEGCRLAGAVGLSSAKLGAFLKIEDSHLGINVSGAGLEAFNAQLDSGVLVLGSTSVGSIDLAGARIRGQVVIDDSQVAIAPSASLVLNGSTIEQDIAISGGADIGADHVGTSLNGDALRCRELVVSDAGTRLRGCLRVAGADIQGQLQIRTGAHLDANDAGNSLEADSANISAGVQFQDISMTGAASMGGLGSPGGVNLTRARLGANEKDLSLTLNSAITRHIHLEGVALDGGVEVGAARLNQDLTIRRGRLGASTEGWSIAADRLQATMISLDGPALIEGGVSLSGATFSSQVSVGPGVRIGGTGAGSLRAEGARMADLHIHGPMTLLSRHIGLHHATILGQLTIRRRAAIGASEPSGPSVFAHGLRATDVIVGEARLRGGLDLSGATVDAHLELGPGSLLDTSDAETVLSIPRGRVGRLRLSATGVRGRIDLSDAHVTVLEDLPCFWWPEERAVMRIAGATIGRFTDPARFSSTDRLRWVKGRVEGLHRGDDSEFRPIRASFAAIARAQSSSGDREGEIETLVLMRKALWPWPLRALLTPIRQGLRPLRAAWLFLATLGVTVAIVYAAHVSGLMIATGDLSPTTMEDTDVADTFTSEECSGKNYPCLRPVVYSVDVLIPGLSMGDADRWQPRTEPIGSFGWPEITHGLLTVCRLLGWLFGGLFLFGSAKQFLEDRGA
jgi:hypothetical protein